MGQGDEGATPSVALHHGTPVLVLGAGIIGLTVATLLREAGCRSVTVWAKDFPPHTTSNIGTSIACLLCICHFPSCTCMLYLTGAC